MKTKQTPSQVVKDALKGGKAAKATKSDRYEVTSEDYEGNPLCVITDSEARNPMFSQFKFGLNKARMMLACVEGIRAFVKANEK